MKSANSIDVGKRILQGLAILYMCFIVVFLFHKGFADIERLAQNCPDDFWRVLAKYLIGNLAGGRDYSVAECLISLS